MSGLNKEVWIKQIKERYYPDASFLKYVTDMTEYVENDKINLADAGFDPEVLINNTTYPISIAEREDIPLSIELDLYETENTLVRSPHAVELAYDKLESVVKGHRNALMSKSGEKSAHAYSPSANTASTPVIATTGENNGEGYKKMLPKDILTLKRKYDDADFPIENRFLVLCPRHLEDLIDFDLKSFKDITEIVNGTPKKFAGFNILQYSKTAYYVASTLVKTPFGSAVTNLHTYSSFSFITDEVMKADGTMKMFEKIDDPELRATVVGFDKRFIGLPIRNKGIGAIVASKI